jgi:hypothetical protein
MNSNSSTTILCRKRKHDKNDYKKKSSSSLSSKKKTSKKKIKNKKHHQHHHNNHKKLKKNTKHKTSDSDNSDDHDNENSGEDDSDNDDFINDEDIKKCAEERQHAAIDQRATTFVQRTGRGVPIVNPIPGERWQKERQKLLLSKDIDRDNKKKKKKGNVQSSSQLELLPLLQEQPNLEFLQLQMEENRKKAEMLIQNANDLKTSKTNLLRNIIENDNREKNRQEEIHQLQIQANLEENDPDIFTKATSKITEDECKSFFINQSIRYCM